MNRNAGMVCKFALVRRMEDADPSDFLSEAEYDFLIDACDRRLQCLILRESADGYFDVMFTDGTKVDALSWYHLTGMVQPA